MLVMVVLGGMGTIIGPVFGALAFTLLPEYLRVAEVLRLLLFGGILVIAVLFMPGGLAELWSRLHTFTGIRQRSKNV
jgi:branched-chain amino acid transport system permease protein